MSLRDLIEGKEYINAKKERVQVTGFCRHVESRENFVRFKPVSFVTSGPHDMVATEAWWYAQGFVEAPAEESGE